MATLTVIWIDLVWYRGDMSRGYYLGALIYLVWAGDDLLHQPHDYGHATDLSPGNHWGRRYFEGNL